MKTTCFSHGLAAQLKNLFLCSNLYYNHINWSLRNTYKPNKMVSFFLWNSKVVWVYPRNQEYQELCWSQHILGQLQLSQKTKKDFQHCIKMADNFARFIIFRSPLHDSVLLTKKSGREVGLLYFKTNIKANIQSSMQMPTNTSQLFCISFWHSI